MPLEEPHNRAEIDRNALIACWLMMLPSLVLYFEFHFWILSLLFFGGILRLTIDAIRLPNGQLGSFKILFIGSGAIVALSLKFESIVNEGWIFLTFFLAFVAYADWKFVRYNRENPAGSP